MQHIWRLKSGIKHGIFYPGLQKLIKYKTYNNGVLPYCLESLLFDCFKHPRISNMRKWRCIRLNRKR